MAIQSCVKLNFNYIICSEKWKLETIRKESKNDNKIFHNLKTVKKTL